MAHNDAAGGQHLFHHAKAQRKAKVKPDRVADDLGREAITGIAGGKLASSSRPASYTKET